MTKKKTKIALTFTADEIAKIAANKNFFEIENIFKRISPKNHPFYFDIVNIIEKRYKLYYCFNLFYNLSTGSLTYARTCLTSEYERNNYVKYDQYFNTKFYSYKQFSRKEKLKDI